MEFRVLGPIEAVGDGAPIVLSGRRRALLAYLLIHAGRPVSADRILEDVWGDASPESGAKSVAFHVSRLRAVLEPARPPGSTDGILATVPGGYLFRPDPEQVDAGRFERLAAEGRRLAEADPEAARERLAAAVALWRGEAYAEVADEPFARVEVERLRDLRARAVEDGFAADLDLGRDADLVERLEAFVAEEPYRERARGQLMVALYRAGRQADALRVYADGRRLLAEELGIDPSPEVQQLEGWILRQDPRLDARPRSSPRRNPYKGLRPFEESDSGDFFGREALTARLIERLGQVARAGRLLLVVGPSGCGKSSVVRAGLIPALRAGALPGSDRWRIVVMSPGTRPLAELAAASSTIDPEASRGIADPGRPDAFARAVAAMIPPDGRLVLVVDQLEEAWSLVADDEARESFLGAIGGALAAPDGRLVVVATLRADYFDRPLLSPHLGSLVRAGTEAVTAPAPAELERAIARPAEAVGVAVEPGLAAEIASDVARRPGEMPLLEYALTELFTRSGAAGLTRDGYAAIGGAAGALGRRAEEVYGSLDGEAREVTRQVFLRLVAVDGTGAPVARRVARGDLRTIPAGSAILEEVLGAFDRARLLGSDRDAISGEPVVEAAHEALFSGWTRLARWIDEAREDLWTRRRLADATAEWERSGRDPGYLLTGSRLERFGAWAAATDLSLDPAERALLDASLAERLRRDDAEAARLRHERAMERRAAVMLRALVAVLAVAAVVASSLAVVVSGQGEAAREQGDVAVARELAAGSVGNLATDPRLSLVLAWRAARATADRGYVAEEAMDAMHWALQAAHVAYPAGDVPVAVRASPDGPRGVELIDPGRLMELAEAAAAGRALSPEECRTYLHAASCPAVTTGAVSPLRVRTAGGVVPVESLAAASLAGSRVDVASELPIDLAPFASAIIGSTGIEMRATVVSDADLAGRAAAGDLPDVAIVDRPEAVAELARAGLLVDLSTVVDAASVRAGTGTYLMGLGTVAGPSGATTRVLRGAPFATVDADLVWYPEDAFARAGYSPPRTLDDLRALTDRMVADGRTPWCLGLADPTTPGAEAAAFVEGLVLHGGGSDAYDAWIAGTYSSRGDAVRSAFGQAIALLAATRVLGGIESARLIPHDVAAWPLFVDPPDCWLYRGASTDPITWPEGSSAGIGAFPFPDADASGPSPVLGRVYMVVVFHDRPEVRRVVRSLLTARGSRLDVDLAAAGIRPVTGVDPSLPQDAAAAARAARLDSAVRDGTFRIRASDAVPAAVSDALRAGALRVLTDGPSALATALDRLDATRWTGP